MDPRAEAVLETLMYLKRWVRKNLDHEECKNKILREINDIIDDIEEGTYETFRMRLKYI